MLLSGSPYKCNMLKKYMLLLAKQRQYQQSASLEAFDVGTNVSLVGYRSS